VSLAHVRVLRVARLLARVSIGADQTQSVGAGRNPLELAASCAVEWADRERCVAAGVRAPVFGPEV
jgi:hypothetical protein